MPGGGRLKLEPARPIHLDAVAADFPDLQIVMAHPAWPWQDEQLAVALHKPNTWIDLSGWSPRRFSPDLVRNIRGRCRTGCCSGPTTRSYRTSSGSARGRPSTSPTTSPSRCFLAQRRMRLTRRLLGAAASAGATASTSAGSASRTPLRFASNATSLSAGSDGAAPRSGRPASETHEVHPPYASSHGDGHRLVEPVHAQHEHPQRVAALPLQPRLRVVVGPDRLRVERGEVLGLGDRRDVGDVGPARQRDRLADRRRRSRGRSSAGTRP